MSPQHPSGHNIYGLARGFLRLGCAHKGVGVVEPLLKHEWHRYYIKAIIDTLMLVAVLQLLQQRLAMVQQW